MNGIQEKQTSESVQNANLHGGIKKKNNNYYWKNRKYWQEYKHKHYLKNKKRYLELNKKWVEENKEKVKIIKKRYLLNNKFNRMITVKMGDIKDRCNNKNNTHFKFYGGKGVKCLIKKEDLIFMWNRDKAHLLKRASIDRIDSNKDYTIKNCRFIEHYDNSMDGLSKTPTHRKKMKFPT